MIVSVKAIFRGEEAPIEQIHPHMSIDLEGIATAQKIIGSKKELTHFHGPVDRHAEHRPREGCVEHHPDHDENQIHDGAADNPVHRIDVPNVNSRCFRQFSLIRSGSGTSEQSGPENLPSGGRVPAHPRRLHGLPRYGNCERSSSGPNDHPDHAEFRAFPEMTPMRAR